MPYLRHGTLLAILPGLLLPLPALGAAAPIGGSDHAQAGSPRAIDCRCRANGRTYELGQRVCLPTPSGHRVAECRMVQNVTSWSFDQEDCSLSARLTTFQKGQATTASASP